MGRKIYQSKPVQSSEITPEGLYLNRRKFMQLFGTMSLAAVIAACTPNGSSTPTGTPTPIATKQVIPGKTDELGEPLTSFADVTSYNNYYEFTAIKSEVAGMAKNFTTTPWTVQVDGRVNNPKTYDLDDIRKRFPAEERIYRMRCVEGWSMVIPWYGFPLSKLLKEVDPQASAKFVRFTSVNRPSEMPGFKDKLYPWPYTEGLRLDEAMHDLTLLCTGLYGKDLLPQDGAPIRLVVPWKYGIKSAKAIVHIELIDKEPPTFWDTILPDEYGFYSNVNPKRRHPRWSQATERRIGEQTRRATMMFNGYGDQVAQLYANQDLINVDY